MKTCDLENLIGAPQSDDPMLFQKVSARLAEDEPQLRSLIWMLREGVIGQSQFQNLLTTTLRN